METNCSKAHVTKHLCKVFFFFFFLVCHLQCKLYYEKRLCEEKKRDFVN